MNRLMTPYKAFDQKGRARENTSLNMQSLRAYEKTLSSLEPFFLTVPGKGADIDVTVRLKEL